jgi:two-component system response regulator HydG
VIKVETQGTLLIVDDELSVRDSLGKWFREEGYEIGTAESASDALTRMAENKWDLALLDIKMRGSDGVELQRRLHEMDPDLIVIMMTGYASVETAVTALKNGAYDYVSKPLDPDEIAHLVKKALAHHRAEKENVRLRETVAEITRPGELVGKSAAMRKVLEAIETVGPTDANVLITGERGTGKELVVRAIHAASWRRFHPLVVIHCGALTETLLESELFGHEKGAFTGAQYRKKGKFEIAEGGTVFLDEIGDISLKTQTDLLRVLQEREITRVGGNQVIKVDFRCVAATPIRGVIPTKVQFSRRMHLAWGIFLCANGCNVRFVMISSLRVFAVHSIIYRGDYAAGPDRSGDRGQPGNREGDCPRVGAEWIPRRGELLQRSGISGRRDHR